jgi:hypothetical protein
MKMDKMFYRVDKDFCHNKTWRYAGTFLDSDTDDMPDADVLAVCAHEEEPVWSYYSFAKGMTPVFQVLDGVTSRDEAMRIGLDMKTHESYVRQQRMFECGIVLGLEDANLMTESGRGVCDMERFICNW